MKVPLGMPGRFTPPPAPPGVGHLHASERFPVAARRELADHQLRTGAVHARVAVRASAELRVPHMITEAWLYDIATISSRCLTCASIK